MPAMPKPKAATAVSLAENNFSDLKLKELSVAPATMGTSVNAGVVDEQLANSSAQHRSNMGCGCGNGTAAPLSGQSDIRHILRSECYANEHLTSLSSTVDSSASALKVSNDEEKNTRQRQTHQCYQPTGNISSLSNENGKNKTANSSYNNNYSCPSKDGGISTSTSNNGISTVGNCSNTKSFGNKVNVVTTPPKKSPTDFIFGRYIGEGSFSNVYLAVDVHTHNEFAIKVCDKRHILREKKQEYIRREREVMHMMTNVPGFVNLSCTFQDARFLYFVMTYAINGDLLPFINRVGSFDVDCARHYAAELLLACEQMHSRNIIHRDLKPENILLDENMHTLIADFGSAKILNSEERAIEFAKLVELSNQQKEQSDKERAPTNSNDTRNNGNKASSPTRQNRNKLRQNRNSSARNENNSDENSADDGGSSNDTGSDDVDSPERDYYNSRRRRYSFVGTAQYVSPEVLQNGPITPSADLWALGCIVYQMISGLPPFRGPNEFVIFREILKGQLHFPQGFDKDAEDLVRQLLKINPSERLGALDAGNQYTSIRSHAFFKNVQFEKLRKLKPPPICPYLPGVVKDEDFRATMHTMEPGLDDRQLTRLMGLELGTTFGEDSVDGPSNSKSHKPQVNTLSNGTKSNAPKNSFELCNSEKQRRLEQQMFDKWHVFTNNEVILKQGYVNKRKGLFARKRMLLLTTGPHLVYIDPVQMIKKGEIPWSAELRVEAKNFKIFLVHTPNRTYYLDDPEGYSLQWVDAIDKMHELTYKSIQTTESSDGASTAAATSTSAPKTTENAHMPKASSSLSTSTTLVKVASTSPLSSPNRCGSAAVHRKSTSTSN